MANAKNTPDNTNTKNTPDNKGTEQRAQQTGYGKVGDTPNRSTQPGDRSDTDGTRNDGLPGTQRKGAETTQAGGSDRNMGGPNGASKTTDANRTDRDVAANRTTGQNPTGTRDTNGELRNEDEEDVDNMATSEDTEANDEDTSDTDDATKDEDATAKMK